MTSRSLIALTCAGLLSAMSSNAPSSRIAYHQHLVSPATAQLISVPGYDGAALLADLDRAGTTRAVVLSMAYTYGDERKRVAYPDDAVRAENDWTAAQIAKAGGRLIGFCSVNPLREAAEAEIRRCTRLPGMHGLKMHFGNSGVSLRDPSQLATLRRVFALSDELRLPIVVHMHARTGAPYGRQDAALFLAELMPLAPHVSVQIAHLGGSGAFPADAEKAMQVFADAIRRGDPRTARLYFDLTTVIMPESTKADGEKVAVAVRSVGLSRVLFGSDLPVGGNLAPKESWALFRTRVPLTAREFRIIAANQADYVGDPTGDR